MQPGVNWRYSSHVRFNVYTNIVLRKLTKLNTKLAGGPHRLHGVPSIFLKRCVHVLSDSPSFQFDHSFNSSVLYMQYGYKLILLPYLKKVILLRLQTTDQYLQHAQHVQLWNQYVIKDYLSSASLAANLITKQTARIHL